MSTTATMMYGHVETVPERVEHMRRIRELQDETHGFRAFISWTFQRDGNRLSEHVSDEQMPTSFDYLLTQAVSPAAYRPATGVAPSMSVWTPPIM